MGVRCCHVAGNAEQWRSSALVLSGSATVFLERRRVPAVDSGPAASAMGHKCDVESYIVERLRKLLREATVDSIPAITTANAHR